MVVAGVFIEKSGNYDGEHNFKTTSIQCNKC